MIKSKSKFDFNIFYGGYDSFAVSKQKYTKEQATELAKIELETHEKPYYIAVGSGFVTHRAGINEDGEPGVGWWLEYKEHERSCPAWVFHRTTDSVEWDNKEYECIEVSQ